MEDGRSAEATAALTQYMADNAAQMMATANELHAALAGEAAVA